MTDLATLRTRLAEAEEALHRLNIGEAVASLTHTIAGTNAVTYTAANVDKLERYVAQLTAKVALAEGRLSRRVIRYT